jgi:hypothetical protein
MAMFYLSDELDEMPALPELVELLGEKLTCRLLEVFAGRTITLPSVARVRAAAFAVTAFQRVERLRKRMSLEKAIERVAAEMKESVELVRARSESVLRLVRDAEDRLREMREESCHDERAATHPRGGGPSCP